jgi:two-component system OmpR family sensor kinase
MLRSLRSRLVASVLGLAAVGLVVLGAVTYFEQRHFLYQRVDQQLHRAGGPLVHALVDQGLGVNLNRDRDEPGPGGGRPGGGGPPGDSDLPQGTFGQLRAPDGRVLGSHRFTYGESLSIQPDLPAALPLDRIFAVGGRGDDTSTYHVLATRSPFDGTTLVVAIPLGQADQTLHRLLTVEALVIAGVLLALGFASWLVVRVGLLPLDRIGHTADAIAGGDLSHRVETTDPRTETGRLGIALNAMLDRLERAFSERQASEDRLRQFLADASHELRTPLASIRGYSELYRMGATQDPAEVERSMKRIEDEASRMGVLVEDLLTLARLDEVADAPHVAVDVAALACDAVDDARATAPERAIGLEALGPAVASGQPDQLRQVLANLLRNALVHTPAGTPVEVLVARSNGEVRAEVRDHGPGLPDSDPQALFDRFWRAEAGRERGKDGAGLGLAIVAGIVAAHGGRVEARNAEGGGASFVVTLPAF